MVHRYKTLYYYFPTNPKAIQQIHAHFLLQIVMSTLGKMQHFPLYSSEHIVIELGEINSAVVNKISFVDAERSDRVSQNSVQNFNILGKNDRCTSAYSGN